MTAEQDQHSREDSTRQKACLAASTRLFAIVFRIVLISGILAFAAAVGLLLITDRFRTRILLLPAVLIGLGILLARVEYRLDLRSYHPPAETTPRDENPPE